MKVGHLVEKKALHLVVMKAGALVERSVPQLAENSAGPKVEVMDVRWAVSKVEM